MKKIINSIIENKMISIALGVLFFIAGILSRGQFIESNMVMGFVIPLVCISIGFGFIFTSIFRTENRNLLGVFLKAIFAPVAIVTSVVIMNKLGVDSPILRAGALFLINILFFKREVDMAVRPKKVAEE